MKNNVKSGHFVVKFPLTADDLQKTKKGIYKPDSATGMFSDSKLESGLAKNYDEYVVSFVGPDCKSVEVGDLVYLKIEAINHYNTPFEYGESQYLLIPEFELLFNAGKPKKKKEVKGG